MRRLVNLGVALVTLWVTAMAFAASASAEAEFKPATNGTDAGGATILEGQAGTKIPCTSVTSTLTAINVREGTGHYMFAGCKDGTLKCQSLGDGPNTEIILALGSYTIVDLPGGGVGMVLAVSPEVHLECMNATLTLNVLLLIRGNIVFGLTPINKKVKTSEKFTITVTESKGVPTLKEYEEGGSKKTAQLLLSVEGGAFEGSAIESKEDSLTPEKETELKP